MSIIAISNPGVIILIAAYGIADSYGLFDEMKENLNKAILLNND